VSLKLVNYLDNIFSRTEDFKTCRPQPTLKHADHTAPFSNLHKYIFASFQIWFIEANNFGFTTNIF